MSDATSTAGGGRSKAELPDLGWMGVPAAAAHLGVTNRTLYRFINDGQIPAYRLGRVIRLRRRDLDAWLETVRIPPGALDHLAPGRGDGPDDGGSPPAA